MKSVSQAKGNGIIFFMSLIPPVIINICAPSYIPYQIINMIFIIWCSYNSFSFNNKPITTNTITYLFAYIFLGVAPLYQFANQISIWNGAPILPEDYFFATLMLLLALFVYSVTYNIFSKRIKCKYIPHIRHRAYLFSRNKALILCAFSTVITLYAFKSYPILLFFREYNNGSKVVFDTFNNTSLNLIYTIIIRPIPIIVLLYYNLCKNHTKYVSFVLLLDVIVTNFPLSLPRFYVAGLYLPLIFSYYKTLLHKAVLIKLVFLLGVMVIFPFLNQGRTARSISDIKFDIIPNYDMFLSGHFDTFQNGLRVFRDDFITFGRQLVGVVLFWLPRSIWPDKPIGSGGVIADEFNLSFDHISLNYWAEGWINFGIVGMFIFSIALGFMNAKADNKYYSSKQNTIQYSCIYFIYLGMLFFILRGDLISGVAYMIGLVVITLSSGKFILKYHADS